MGESEVRSQADTSQAHDVSVSPSQDCSRSTCEMGEGEEGCLEGSRRAQGLTVTGWKSGRTGGTFGLRVGRENANKFFQRDWLSIDVDFDGKQVTIELRQSFWTDCPELRNPFIRDFLRKRGLAPWPKGCPPKMNLVPLGQNKFSVS